MILYTFTCIKPEIYIVILDKSFTSPYDNILLPSPSNFSTPTASSVPSMVSSSKSTWPTSLLLLSIRLKSYQFLEWALWLRRSSSHFGCPHTMSENFCASFSSECAWENSRWRSKCLCPWYLQETWDGITFPDKSLPYPQLL